MHRRRLLQWLLMGSALGALPRFVSASADKLPIVLLVELNGGNDSLNTVLPLHQLDTYRQLRPQLGLGEEERIRLDERFALHRALSPLKPLWQEGELALVHGLGYPEPNRSHFRSIEIWDTASAADEYLDAGWAATAIAGCAPGALDAIVLGRNAAPVMGGGSRYLRLDGLDQFLRQSKGIDVVAQRDDNPMRAHLIQLQNTLAQGSNQLMAAMRQVPPLRTAFPDTAFGKYLADVAQLIRLDMGIPLYKVALGSFDTHRGQKPAHARLLQQLADGLAALRKELQASGHWEQLLVMTYSEFGRRAAQNGSGGTDHGTAATHFVLGGRVKGGHVGEHPDLTQLEQQDMRYTTDFRRLYRTVLEEWWQLDEIDRDYGGGPSLQVVRNPAPI